MAWPVTRLYTFVLNSAPGYDDVWGNNVEQAINGAYAGTRSLASIKIDGVGGQVVSPSAAQLVVGQSALADTPLTIWKDQGGNNRGIVDHLGYRRGRYNEYFEDYLALGTASIAGASSSSTGRLQYNIPANCTLTNGPSSGIPGAMTNVTITTSSMANATNLQLHSGLRVFFPQTFTSFVCEFEILTVAASNVDWFVGFCDSFTVGGTPNNAQYYLGLCKQASDTTWQLLTGNSSTFTKTNTIVTPSTSAGSPDRITIELHGSASPYGALARIAVNDSVVATTSSTLPTSGSASMNFTIMGTTTSASNSANVVISPVRAIWNRQLSLPTI